MQELIAAFREHDDYEFEMCLCTKTNPEEKKHELAEESAFSMLKVLTESAGKGHFTMSSQVFVDYFYEQGAIRHRCFVKTDDISHKSAQTIRKTRVGRLEATCPERDFMFRFNLKREQPIFDFDTIKAGKPYFVRVQQEWQFVYKSAFLYTIKKVQAGGTSKHECLQQPVHFEIEIELLRDQTYLNSHDDAQLAESIVQKSLDLCGRFKANNRMEKLTIVFNDEQTHDKPRKTKKIKV